MDYKIYTIDSDYVDFLRADPRLRNVFDNEKSTGKYGRVYLGILILVKDIDFYAPFSSPKPTDYIGTKIRNSVIPIIRMTSQQSNGKMTLLGTIKLSNMIPAPKGVCKLYDIDSLSDSFYKALLWKELDFVQKNKLLIFKNAQILFNEKTKKDLHQSQGEMGKPYLRATVDFSYAIEKSKTYVSKDEDLLKENRHP